MQEKQKNVLPFHTRRQLTLKIILPTHISNKYNKKSMHFQWFLYLLSAGYFLGVLIFICFILFSNALCFSQGGEKKQKAAWSDEHPKLLGRFWYKINIVPPQGYHDTGLHIRWIVGYHGCLWRGPFPFYTEEKFLRVWVTQPRNSTSSRLLTTGNLQYRVDILPAWVLQKLKTFAMGSVPVWWR